MLCVKFVADFVHKMADFYCFARNFDRKKTTNLTHTMVMEFLFFIFLKHKNTLNFLIPTFDF